MLTFANAAYPQIPDTLSNEKSKFDFKILDSYAIQENVSKILATLDTIPDGTLTDKEAEVKRNYYKRFRTQDEKYDFNTTDPLIVNVITIYQSYWKNVLLGKNPVKEADKELNRELSSFLYENYLKNENIKKSNIDGNPRRYLSKILSQHGYFSNASGKVGNLFDIYIWAKETKIDYNIDLPEATVKVPVNFMEETITLGWLEYATFGNRYSSGWATDTMLFCVKKAYDVPSELFQTNYLAHEGQHFHDFDAYVYLPPFTLEYRAKLAELSKAKETMFTLLNGFLKGAKNDKKLSHSFAEYRVIKGLSREIFQQDYVADPQKWQSIPYGDINKASEILLKKNSGKLMMKMSGIFSFCNGARNFIIKRMM